MNISPISIGNAPQSLSTGPSNPGLQAVLAVEFSAKAGGTTYSANVQPLDGGFEATVPRLPGVSAAGPTVQQVESDLGHLISFFA
jgi:hypothetical protein